MGAGDRHEGRHRALQMVRLVGGADLHADARLSLRDHRIGEADDVDALRQQVGRHLVGEVRVAQHDGDDRMLPGPDAESRPRSSRAGTSAYWRRAGRDARWCPRAARGRRARRDTSAGGSVFEKRYGRERWRRRSTISRRAAVKPPLAPPSALPRVEVMMSTRPATPQCSGVPRPVGPKKPGGVAVVHHDERVVALGQVADLGERRDVAVHGEDAVGGDQARPRVPRVPEDALEIGHVRVLRSGGAGPGRAGCRR